MAVRVVSTRDQQPLTVNALVDSPLIVPERIISEFEGQFIMDEVLRNVGKAQGGAVQFRVSSPQFADIASQIVNEGAEIPLATVSKGDIQSKPVQKRGLGVLITQEMRDRNSMGEVTRQITAIRNTLVRDVDGAFVTALNAAITLTRAATAVWTNAATATIRKDILAAKRLVRTATVAGTTDSYLGYEPTHLLVNPTDEANLLGSAEFTALLFGQVNPSNVSTFNDLPGGGNILGLKPRSSVSVAAGTALVVTQNEIGGYADEQPLNATELYSAGLQPRQSFRSDVVRSTVGFIDQPLAGSKITGV